MSEEEKKAIKLLEYYVQNFFDDKEERIILNLIKKQQKEIERYKEIINALKPNLKELLEMSNFAMQKDYVSKDKIRAKIKELEENIKKKRQLNIKEWVGFEENEIEILEELLEEN